MLLRALLLRRARSLRTLLLSALLLLLLLFLLRLAGTSALAALLLAISAFAAAARLAGALFELAHFLFQKARGLAVLLEAQLVVPAVRAALPPLGIGFFAGSAEDAFRQRHREIGAHCTLRPVDENRRRTLLALLELAEENSPSACWDDQRAMDLLRRDATREELRELGADAALIDHIFSEPHAG